MTDSEKTIKDKEKTVDDTRQKLIQLTAEFKTLQTELNQKIVEVGAEEFADADVGKLLVSGITTHESKIAGIPFKIRTVTKSESLNVDKRSKDYFQESSTFYSNSVMVDTLVYALVSYNGKSSLYDETPESFDKAKSAVGSLSEEVLFLIWNVYSRLTKYLRAYLEINLKN